MGKLTAIRVKNLRSLKDTELIYLKPITILVGKNSVGKSTFARLLLLLRQTAEESKKEPILWWGRFVDFGSFTDSICRKADTEEIEFGFRVEISYRDEFRHYYIDSEPDFISTVNAAIAITKNEKIKHSSRLSRVSLELGDNKAEIFVDNDQSVTKIEINGKKIEFISGASVNLELRGIFPQIEFKDTKSTRVSLEVRHYYHYHSFDSIAILNMLIDYLKKSGLVHKGTQNDTLQELIFNLRFSNNKVLLESMKQVKPELIHWNKNVSQLTLDDPKFIAIRDMLLVLRIPSLLRRVDNAVAGSVGSTHYIEPLRATAERYYRRQGLAVDEVDSKGANVPFYIDNLSKAHKQKFDAWMLKHFEATVETDSSGGHISIFIKDKYGDRSNLADVGFGFSQVLPVALQLWSALTPKSNRRMIRGDFGKTVVIEQPELHLHPEFQSKIADLLVDTISESEDLRVVLETHSPSIINKIGYLISEGKIDPSFVSILIFEQEKETNLAHVRTARFRENGELENWPIGFFDA